MLTLYFKNKAKRLKAHDNNALRESDNANLCYVEFDEKFDEWYLTHCDDLTHIDNMTYDERWAGNYLRCMDWSYCDFTDNTFPVAELMKIQQTENYTENLRLYQCEFLNDELPKFICELKNLKVLNLGVTFVNKFPDEFANLQKLEELFLYENDTMDELPKVICECKNLKVLDLENCSLSKLPNEFINLQKLEKLDINDNFNEFPKIILELPNLKELLTDERLITPQIADELKRKNIA